METATISYISLLAGYTGLYNNLLAFKMDTDIIIKILMLLIYLTGAYYAGRGIRHKDKESKQTRPTIARLTGYGHHFHLIITNNKPHPITIQKITAKRKWYGPIFFKSVPLEWNPSTDYKPNHDNSIHAAFDRFNAIPQYTVTTQRVVNVELKKHVDGIIYEICVATTGGKCRIIYHSPLKPPGVISNTADKKQ